MKQAVKSSEILGQKFDGSFRFLECDCVRIEGSEEDCEEGDERTVTGEACILSRADFQK